MGAVGRHGHGFLAAGNNDGRIAGNDLLHAKGHGAQAGTTELIETEGGCFLGNSGLHRRLPRRVLPFARRQDLTENDFIDFASRDAGAFQHGADDGRPSSWAGVLAKWPLKEPTAVRAALAITIEGRVISFLLTCGRRLAKLSIQVKWRKLL